MKAPESLQEFLKILEKEGELYRVKEEVSPELEITEITDRTVKAGGPALLFERVKGHKIPVITNLFGSYKRLCLALGVRSLEELSEKLINFIEIGSAEGLFWKIKTSSQAFSS